MTQPTFLPWLRRGFASGAGPVDPLAGALPATSTIEIDVALTDDVGGSASATHTRALVGPGSVSSIDPGQIVRYEPPPGSSDVETNGFPFVELLAPDLPWVLTPATATAAGALRPWLVLVVVDESADVSFDQGVLTVTGDAVATELWDLADSYAWAHVQSSVPASDVIAEVERGSGAVAARLVCPRKLRASRRYRAAIVPAFDAGVAAGLGEPVPAGDLAPAWDVDATNPVRLPVYATWTFSTSARPGDFESLASKLQPDSSGGRIGFHECRLDPGGLLPEAPKRLDLSFEFAGALIDPGSTARPLPAEATAWLEPRLQRAVELGAQRPSVPSDPPAGYDPERDDPVLAPVLYGQYASGQRKLPASGWVREVNLTGGHRAAAGLGAEIVRQSQHEFLAAAWEQTAALREAVVEANRARLSAEVADRHHTRLSTLGDGELLFAVGRAKETIQQGRSTVGAVLQRDRVTPTGVVSAAFFRSTRAGAAVSRHAPRLAGRGRSAGSLAGSVAGTFLAAAGSDAPAQLEQVAAFTASFVPDGAILASARTTGFVGVGSGSRQPRPDVGSVLTGAMRGSPMLRSQRRRENERAGRAGVATAAIPSRRVIAVGTAGETVAGSATAVRRAVPSASIAASFSRRSSGLDGGGVVPTRVVVGAWFPDGLAPKLQAISPELLVPGVGAFAMNRVRLLEINEPFVASLLIGANHEWAREALWREFPADLAATSFASLFDRPGDPPAPGPATDLNSDLHNVALGRSLGSMIGGAGSGTVLLIRAELVRRYPGLIVTLLEPGAGGNPPLVGDEIDPAVVTEPMFVGRLDASTMFVGFDVDPKTLLDEGWWVNLEQPDTGPRFGLDARGGRLATLPDDWKDLTWAHVRGADSDSTHLRFSRLGWTGEVRGGIEWGRNAAHQAAIVHQRPFRMLFPAPALIVRPRGDR